VPASVGKAAYTFRTFSHPDRASETGSYRSQSPLNTDASKLAWSRYLSEFYQVWISILSHDKPELQEE
jgi:hypothetical protein